MDARRPAWLLASVVFLIFPPPVGAQTFEVCVGEYENMCGAAHSAWFNCGTRVEDAARSLCTLHTNNGDVMTSYRVVNEYTHGGNRCGYAGFTITCVP